MVSRPLKLLVAASSAPAAAAFLTGEAAFTDAGALRVDTVTGSVFLEDRSVARGQQAVKQSAKGNIAAAIEQALKDVPGWVKLVVGGVAALDVLLARRMLRAVFEPGPRPPVVLVSQAPEGPSEAARVAQQLQPQPAARGPPAAVAALRGVAVASAAAVGLFAVGRARRSAAHRPVRAAVGARKEEITLVPLCAASLDVALTALPASPAEGGVSDGGGSACSTDEPPSPEVRQETGDAADLAACGGVADSPKPRKQLGVTNLKKDTSYDTVLRKDIDEIKSLMMEAVRPLAAFEKSLDRFDDASAAAASSAASAMASSASASSATGGAPVVMITEKEMGYVAKIAEAFEKGTVFHRVATPQQQENLARQETEYSPELKVDFFRMGTECPAEGPVGQTLPVGSLAKVYSARA